MLESWTQVLEWCRDLVGIEDRVETGVLFHWVCIHLTGLSGQSVLPVTWAGTGISHAHMGESSWVTLFVSAMSFCEAWGLYFSILGWWATWRCLLRRTGVGGRWQGRHLVLSGCAVLCVVELGCCWWLLTVTLCVWSFSSFKIKIKTYCFKRELAVDQREYEFKLFKESRYFAF